MKLLAKIGSSLALFIAVFLQATPIPRTGFQWDTVKLMAIQDRGRTKPFETFAAESVLYITGKRSWEGLSAEEVVFGWLIAYDKEWEGTAFIRVDHEPLKLALGLDKSARYFTPKELEQNTKLPQLVREAMQKEQRKERQTEIDKKALQIQNQRGLLEAIVTGRAWNLLPNPDGLTKDWLSLVALGDQSVALPYTKEQADKLTEAIKKMLGGFVEKDPARWNSATLEFAGLLRNDLANGQYPSVAELKRESHYNNLHPFRMAWILYLVAFVALLFYNTSGNQIAKFAGMAFITAGFVIHAYGFTLRCLIAGRPPVTNMFESVIWVAWGCMLFSLIIWAVYKNSTIPTAASVFAIVALILADNLPLALDPSIQPLEPVLRSNYWLTIHVLTITMGYAAFALSLCLGNVVIGNYFWRATETGTIQQYSLYMYRAMQIGVVLLAAGTILGGIWADYSWGRFWGWDPKEVWALIALLLYLAVLHGRFTGWLKGFGFAATTVVSFLGVLMAWYGVNFVLGAGLHSYGFGTGGIGWVSTYIALQVLFIVGAYLRYSKVKGETTPTIFPKGT